MKLNLNQKIAHKYYKAYSALCGEHYDGIEGREQCEMRAHREVMHMLYKKYDPNNSFDVIENEKDYDEVI